MTDEPAVAVSDVRLSFGDLAVLDGISLAAGRGAVTCLVGPNGSGKTTLLRVVAGLLPADGGTVERSAGGARPVGYLAQAPAFRPQFTVRETLGFYAALVGTDADVDAIAERVGLGGVTGRRVEALSGGMTRLLGIAQATIGDPDLLVLDEPSSGLDPMMTRHVTDAVSTLAGDDRAVLIATHDMGAVDRIADHVVLLDRGRVVATGSPDDLRAEADAPDLAGAMAALVGHEAGEVATREAAPRANGAGRDDCPDEPEERR